MKLGCEVDDDGALKAGGESYVVRDPGPCTVRQLRLDIWRDLFHAGLPRGIERSRAEVVNVAGHEQAQRGVSVHRTQVECQGVEISKPIVRRQLSEAAGKLMIAAAHLGENIAAFAVPCACGRPCAF